MSKLSKLFKLKKYLSVEEARQHLSNVFEEEVSIVDLYGFVLDRHLTISVQFDCIFQMAQGYLTDIENTLQFANEKNSYRYGSGKILSFEDHRPMQGEGVWDLTLFGREFIDIDRLRSELKGIQQWNIPPANAVILQKTTFRGDVIYAKLMEASKDQFVEEKPLRPYPETLEILKNQKPVPLIVDSQSLNSYPHHLVFRREELERFINSINDMQDQKQQDVLPEEKKQLKPKEMNPKERTTLLTLLGTVLKEAKYDIAQRGIARSLKLATELYGKGLDEDTIRSTIKKVRAHEAKIKENRN